MFSMISGSPIELGPGFPREQASRFRAEAERFTETWTPEVAHGMHEVAHAFLDQSGLHGEPVTWHPRPLCSTESSYPVGPLMASTSIASTT
jgi:hypothetical protein